MGRPARWSTPEELERAMEGYFEQEGEGAMLQGLCAYLGTDPSTLRRYGSGERGEEFCAPVKRAAARLGAIYERLGREAKNPVFAIFMSKNLGLIDKQEVEHSGEVAIGGIRELFSAVVGKPEGAE